MQTITKNTDELTTDLLRCVRDVSDAFSQVENALNAERSCRAQLHSASPEAAALVPKLKLADHVKLCSTGSRDYFEYIGKWRVDAIARGLLEKGA